MPKIGSLTYNGVSSTSLGIYITGAPSYDAAELDITAYSVPGRNGDILIPNNRYKNITLTYPAFIPYNFSTNAQAIRNWLRSSETYARLTDTYDTLHERSALAIGIQKFDPTIHNTAANFKLVFNCKPQRFRVIGSSTITSPHTAVNPTKFDALPRFLLTNISSSSAYISVTNTKYGVQKMEATGAFTGGVYIDCGSQNIYTGAVNHNDLFTGDFPILAPGSNTIQFSGIGTVSFTPFYWEL